LVSSSADFTQLRPTDFYNLNLEEFFWKPVELMVDLVTYAPGVVYDFLVQTPGLIRHLEDAIGRARFSSPSGTRPSRPT